MKNLAVVSKHQLMQILPSNDITVLIIRGMYRPRNLTHKETRRLRNLCYAVEELYLHKIEDRPISTSSAIKVQEIAKLDKSIVVYFDNVEETLETANTILQYLIKECDENVYLNDRIYHVDDSNIDESSLNKLYSELEEEPSTQKESFASLYPNISKIATIFRRYAEEG